MIAAAMLYHAGMATKTPFARWLYDFRARHLQQTQDDFARSLRMSKGTIQSWEYGKQRPSGAALVLLQKMAEESGYEPPPEVDTGRGPRIREEE